MKERPTISRTLSFELDRNTLFEGQTSIVICFTVASTNRLFLGPTRGWYFLALTGKIGRTTSNREVAEKACLTPSRPSGPTRLFLFASLRPRPQFDTHLLGSAKVEIGLSITTTDGRIRLIAGCLGLTSPGSPLTIPCKIRHTHFVGSTRRIARFTTLFHTRFCRTLDFSVLAHATVATILCRKGLARLVRFAFVCTHTTRRFDTCNAAALSTCTLFATIWCQVRFARLVLFARKLVFARLLTRQGLAIVLSIPTGATATAILPIPTLSVFVRLPITFAAFQTRLLGAGHFADLASAGIALVSCRKCLS
jgi:hypothetical protein